MSKLFSVLISVYHREKGEYLAAALTSVFDQTVPPNEVVLVEDGKLTDELYAVIDDFKCRFDTLKSIKLPQNVGLGEALNKGLTACSHNLVARMDSDDICKPNRFEKQLQIFDKKPDLAVVGSWVDEFDQTIDNIISIRKLPENIEDIKKYATRRSPCNHPSVMFVKDKIISVGGYQHFYLFEDYYLWVRIIQAGYSIYNIQENLLFFRTNQQMIARRGGWKYAMSELRLQRAFLRMGFIGWWRFLKNVIIRFTVRLMPNKLRIAIYKNFLRK